MQQAQALTFVRSRKLASCRRLPRGHQMAFFMTARAPKIGEVTKAQFNDGTAAYEKPWPVGPGQPV